MNKKLSFEGVQNMCRKRKIIMCSILILFSWIISAGPADAQKKPKIYTIESSIEEA
jgi:hypothetical protein